METNKQLALVKNYNQVGYYLRAASQKETFISRHIDNLNDKILSFVYQCKKIKSTDLAKCTLASIAEAFKTSLDIGIPVDATQMAYLLVYGNELTYQIGYKGLLYKVRKLRPGIYIEANLLYKDDEFSYQSQSGKAEYTYKPKNPTRADFGQVSGGFVFMSWLQNGREYSCIHTMSREEIDQARKASKAGNYGPWNSWPGEMMKKVILRRACKIEFIGDPEMEAVLDIDNREYNFDNRGPKASEQAKAVNYCDVQPLEEPTILNAETEPKQPAEIIEPELVNDREEE